MPPLARALLGPDADRQIEPLLDQVHAAIGEHELDRYARQKGPSIRDDGIRKVLAGATTLALLILPVIIIAAQEAIRAVPSSIRFGAYALGATRWQVTRRQVLPLAMPGILTGTILALSRAIGETAPLIVVGAVGYVAFLPEGVLDQFTVLPIQIFDWIGRPQAEFHELAASAIVVLLAVLLTMNAVAIVLRNRFQRPRG